MANTNETDLTAAINTAKTVENLEKEAALRFGARVTVAYDAEFPASRITAPDDFNVRFAAGMTVGGVTLTGDLRNIGGMADDIRALRGITTPLLVSHREDGSYWLCQGFRRYNGAKLVREQEPGSALANKLANLPCIIYAGLTREQERLLVNDQTSKQFSAAEVFNHFVEQYRGGYAWLNICERMYPQIGQVTNSTDIVRKIDKITDQGERQKALREWLLTTVYQGWVNGIKSGPVVLNLWLQTYLWQDGFAGVNRPRVVMNTMRMRKLWTAVTADGVAGEFNATAGTGPRMDKLLDEYATEDAANYNADGSKKKKVKAEAAFALKSAKDVQELIGQETVNGVPGLLARVYAVTGKNGGDPEATSLVRNFDRCREVYLQHRAYLKPSAASVLTLIFGGVSGSEEKFAEFLADNYQDTDAAPSHEQAVSAAREVSNEVPAGGVVPPVVTEGAELVTLTVPVDVLPNPPAEINVPTGEGDGAEIANEMPTTVDGPEPAATATEGEGDAEHKSKGKGRKAHAKK